MTQEIQFSVAMFLFCLLTLLAGGILRITECCQPKQRSDLGRKSQTILYRDIVSLINIFSSRRDNNWWRGSQHFTWFDRGNLQFEDQEKLPPSPPPGRWEGRTQPVWSPPVWWLWLNNTTILSDVESTNWRVHPHLSHTEREEI